MERCKIRRRSFVDNVFGSPTPVADGAVVRLPRSGVAFEPAQPLALLGDAADDLLVVPGVVCVARASALAGRLSNDSTFVRVEWPESDVLMFRSRADGADAVAATLALLASATDGSGAAITDVAPLHGFIAHQKMKSSEDPELSPAIAAPAETGRGAGSVIEVLDTGLAAEWAWPTDTVREAAADDTDPLVGIFPGFLGRSAGHGTFVAGLCHQVAPSASVVVHRIASTEGFVDEATLARTIDAIGTTSAPPDAVVMAFGGYSVKLGSFGTHGKGDSWTQPLLLRSSLRSLLERCPDLVVVASAGNNESSDPCYPAAFAADREFAGRVVSVGALDAAGYRWTSSNYGPWVTSSTLGVRLRGPYVEGREHPSNEPDGSPETFGSPSFASWSGTSFAAALVAGRIVELQAALVADLGRPVPATEAWRVLAASSKPQREGRSGVQILVDGVAHD